MNTLDIMSIFHTKRNMLIFRKLSIVLISLFSLAFSCSANDEIDFFNVGQGHAVLVNRVGRHPVTQAPFVPILIDAGSTSHPFEANENYTWSNEDKSSSVVSRIGERIVHFWKTSTGGALHAGHYQLNVIITHPDKDHKKFVPALLQFLQGKIDRVPSCFFSPHVLLGGDPSLYKPNKKEPDFLEECRKVCKEASTKELFYFSSHPDISGKIFMAGSCSFLDSSGCVTHLFCPTGIKSDVNRWSVITRIQLNGISAILTGDADSTVKKQMLAALNADQKGGICSDLLLAPHHGAGGTYHDEWDGIVNPRVIIIGASPLNSYQHPRGQTILGFLNALGGRGRIWGNSVMPHGIQYCASDSEHQDIRGCFLTRRRLLDEVPNGPPETAAGGGANAALPQPQWHLAWTDLPIYTLWTTGALIFQGNVAAPQFLEAPHGMMPYVAVSDPIYLFDPYARKRLLPLSPTERGLCDQIADLANKRVNKQRRTQDEAMLHKYANIMMQQLFLIDNHKQREIYLEAIHTILKQDRDLYISESFFKWLREAIIEQNMHVREDRLQSVLSVLFAPWGGDEDLDLRMALFSPVLDDKALILKTFLRSTHSPARLKDYILTFGDMTQCGPSEQEIDILCPCGFPEWRQLARLMDFVRTELINPMGESISIMDMMDVVQLRTRGKNFKEIAQAIVHQEILRRYEEVFMDLQQYFPQRIAQNIIDYGGLLEHQPVYMELRKYLPMGITWSIINYEGETLSPYEELYKKIETERYFPKSLDDLLT